MLNIHLNDWLKGLKKNEKRVTILQVECKVKKWLRKS